MPSERREQVREHVFVPVNEFYVVVSLCQMTFIMIPKGTDGALC